MDGQFIELMSKEDFVSIGLNGQEEATTTESKPLREFAPRAPRAKAPFKAIELGRKQDFVLKALEIGLSSNCNFRCDYCCAYNFNDKKFLAGEQVIEILETAPDLERVKLSGGEVLIYFEECVKVVDYCASRGLHTQINTNGSLLNEEKIGILEAAGLDCLHFSFNFTNPKDFQAYYKRDEKVFRRIEDNIRIASKSNIDTVVETVIFKSTEHTLVDVHNHIYELGARKHEIQNGIPIEKNDWAEILPKHRVQEVIANLIENRKPEVELYFSCVDIEPGGPFHRQVLKYITDKSIHFPSCIEGRNQLHVHSNGDVLICELGHPVVIGNLNKGTSLKTILQEPPPALAEFLSGQCGECGCNIRTLVQPA